MKHVLRFLLTLTVLLFTASVYASPITIQTFDQDPISNGWYPDRYQPSKFESKFFDGDNRLYMELDGNLQAEEVFYLTEGMKYDIVGGIGDSISIDLFLDSAWNIDFNDPNSTYGFADQRRFDLWGVTENAAGDTPKTYPIIGFTNTQANSGDDISYKGFQVWDGNNDGWEEVQAIGNDDSLWDTWVNLEITMLSNSFEYRINDDLVYTDTDTNESVAYRNIIIQGKNYDGDQSYGVYFDNLSHPIPEPATMFLFGIGLLGIAGVSRRRKA